MPTIAIFYGIVIQMYGRDHAPPHLHAFYQGFEGLVSIATGELIGGRLPHNAARIVRQWVSLRKAELMENWQRDRHRVPFERVPDPDEEQ